MSNVEAWLLGTAERAGKSVVQVTATTLLALGVALHWASFWHALDIGLLAGVVSVLTSVASIPLSANLKPAYQVGVRAVLTFTQSALAFLSANTFLNLTDTPWLQVFQVSLIAAVTSVLTSWASWNVGALKEHPSVARA